MYTRRRRQRRPHREHCGHFAHLPLRARPFHFGLCSCSHIPKCQFKIYYRAHGMCVYLCLCANGIYMLASLMASWQPFIVLFLESVSIPEYAGAPSLLPPFPSNTSSPSTPPLLQHLLSSSLPRSCPTPSKIGADLFYWAISLKHSVLRLWCCLSLLVSCHFFVCTQRPN